jgi:hypothetical protein
MDIETLFSSVISDSLDLPTMLLALGAALGLGLLISMVYMKTHKKELCPASLTVTLIMLPAIIAIIIMLIGNNIARAFSLAGAFSLIRFRSAPGDPKDIAYVFFTLGVGLACGMGYILYGAIFTAVLCAIMVILHVTKYAQNAAFSMQLKITVPENLNFQGLFDDVLARYAQTWKLKRVKNSDFGSVFEVAYDIKLKDGADQKAFMDEIRCRNGNLNIVLTLNEYEEKSYA